MKKLKPTKHNVTVLHQLCNFIPTHVVSILAKKHGVDKRSRTFTPWSHVVSLLYAQLSHSIGLNDVCDSLRHHATKIFAIRNAKAPSRNALSHANKVRNSEMMKDLFWEVLNHLQLQSPGFGPSGRYSGLPRRFKRMVYAVDSSTIALLANCMDWAKHRRRKAAAKIHMKINLQTFLPTFAIIEEACHNDVARAQSLCSSLQAGEVVVFDKAYVEFKHLYILEQREVFWVTRAKENMVYHVCKRRIKKPQNNILRDDEITLKVQKSRKDYPKRLRRIEALVEVDGEMVTMIFITNNMDWAPSSIADLYQSRWAIEVFFKQIKQTLKICDFLGHSKQAIQWQIWSALLLYVLLRFQAYLSKWNHSFIRLFTMIRGVLWDHYNLLEMLQFYGTAPGRWTMQLKPQTLYLPGLEPESYGTAFGQ